MYRRKPTYFSHPVCRNGVCCALLLLLLCACRPGLIVTSDTDTYLSKSPGALLSGGSMLIVPFVSSPHPEEVGEYAARLFHKRISESGFLTSVSYHSKDVKDIHFPTPADRLTAALTAARNSRADLLLYGSVDEYVTGTATQTSVSLTVKLFSAASGDLLWWVGHSAEGKPGRMFLLIDFFLSPNPPEAYKLMEHSADTITEKLFSPLMDD